jgi:hypothetical protein
MTDPSAVLQQMIGRAAIIRDPDTGNYYVEDRYNWNKGFEAKHGRKFNPFSGEDRALLREDLGAGEDPYDKARVLSQYLGSRSDDTEGPEGSLVRINLGQLDDYYLDEAGQLAARSGREEAEEGPSRRGLGWLRDFFGGDRDVQVDETELTRAPVGTPLPERPAAISFQPPVLESDVDRLKRRLGRVDLDPSSFDPNFDIP